MSRLETFIEELKRRRVVRATGAYVAVSLAVWGAADIATDAFSLSPDVLRLLIVGSVAGLPVAVCAAWLFDIRAAAGSTTTAVLKALGAGFAASALVFALLFATLRETDNPTLTTEHSIAVLPFRDLGPAERPSFLGEGLAEEILFALKRIPGLRVIAPQSSFAMAEARVADMRAQLGVTHVLTGSLRPDGDDLRIHARLLETESENVVWERVFRPQATGFTEAQEQIARAVVNVLEVEIGPVGENGLMNASTENPAAHEEYLRGLRLWNHRSEPEILVAIQHFREAVELDPAYAAAWAGLAYSYLVLPEYSLAVDVGRMREQAVAAATRALEIDPDQTDALTAMGWARMIHEYDWGEAEALIARALAIDSTNLNALHWQSHVVSWQGRHEEAVALARKGVALDPLSSIMRQNLGYILMEAGRYDEALQEYATLETSDPGFTVSRRTVWNVYTRLGSYDRAGQALVQWLTGRGDDVGSATELARAFEKAAERYARTGESIGLSDELLDRARLGVEIEGQMLAAVGDPEGTLARLERAYRERAGARCLLSVQVNPLYDFLRGDPRFEDLVARVGLAEAINDRD